MIKKNIQLRKYLFIAACIISTSIFGISNISAQQIIEESLVSSMMRSYTNYNKNVSSVRGWRIQLLATTDKRQMESAQAKFRNKYPQYKLIYNHEPPFFHLQTGAFLTKQEAMPFLLKMKKDYVGAFLVAGEFEVSEVLSYD